MERWRPGWDEYFMRIAELASTRSTCLRRVVGAVIVKNKSILATGYNGAPSGASHCAEVGCLRDQRKVPSGQHHEICRGLHAEQNAIIQAARHGVSIEGAVMYSTVVPCIICAKMIINASIREVYYIEAGYDELAQPAFEESGTKVIQVLYEKVAT